ncbi:lipoyl domain-containing protein [Streptomyces clavuligerus]|uniref:Dihydrolipoamide succinyltransferase component of 2-oxoglutarate dehydrogenase complex n=1 Tax=Streptomyces clavuligerus TaxID=1901 RepID=D5SLY3_STRCL|nr:lipoyl domain-containing protein [Streptomyces clavuligerus]EFG04926.1 Dihydrolipoamide succinyltransferase component of 2-oxoglutarate dehydrogenase complex [Streptomyces clavuligerus]MBY6306637.1 2-oxoglutarate dehydrogenase [Streptomyces clavuligerus]QCS10756.1 2-oxoglutarate dehydrogenase [Streptomyces clavuligerus]QPJ97209.1 2-oxoglutarate dehydrogenase [Streptomyces clavuligerus]WDN57469.1 lipoyl domain-containing protein [Streptomyces clavuligerus]
MSLHPNAPVDAQPPGHRGTYAVTVPVTGDDGYVVTRWLRRPGETVRENEPLVEVEAAKTVLDVLAPASGVLHRIHVGEGATAAPGERLGTVVLPGPGDLPWN